MRYRLSDVQVKRRHEEDEEAVQEDEEAVQEGLRRGATVPTVRGQHHQWLWHFLVRVERADRGLLRRLPGREEVQKDLRSLPLVLLCIASRMVRRDAGLW